MHTGFKEKLQKNFIYSFNINLFCSGLEQPSL